MDADPKLVHIAIAVVERDGKYLIGRRPADAPLAGLWEFPGGKVEPGESPQTAARRECLEETGLDVAIGEAYSQVVHHYAHAHVRLHFFAARPLGELAPSDARFAWVAGERLGDFAFPPANAALVERLVAQARDRAKSDAP